jgi:hypothetical protein
VAAVRQPVERRPDQALAALCRLYKVSLVEFLRGVGLVD